MLGLETLLGSYTMWNNCTCSPLEDAFENAFARGLGAGLGSGNFKFLGMKLPCMWSLFKVHSQPYVTGKSVTKSMSYVAALHLVLNQN